MNEGRLTRGECRTLVHPGKTVRQVADEQRRQAESWWRIARSLPRDQAPLYDRLGDEAWRRYAALR